MVPPGRQDAVALNGKTVCMVYGWKLAFASRLLREITALQSAGAKVVLFSPYAHEDSLPDGVIAVRTSEQCLPPSENRLRALRIVSNVARNAIRPRLARRAPERQLRRVLRQFKVDVVWAIDWPMLKRYAGVARKCRAAVVYETLDLVAEQAADPPSELAEETRQILRLDGFITAGDSFADYYETRILAAGASWRPVVIDNSPEELLGQLRPSGRAVRLLFLGALTKNRNLPNLVRAMGMVTTDVSLTLQGEDRLDGSLAGLIDELGLRERVMLKPPVPPSRLVESASEYDVGVISLEPVTMSERLAPTTKLQSYLAAGMAVVASDLPGVAVAIRKHDVGWVVSNEDPESWARVIDGIGALARNELDEYRARALKAASCYAWSTQKPRFLAEFSRALGGATNERANAS